MRRLLIVLVLAGCGTEIDSTNLPSIEGYQSWPSMTVSTDIPGHPDSIRTIYAGPVARAYPHGGRYPLDTVIVKEIFERAGGGQKGALRYVAIMRKVGDDTGLPTNAGWLFTQLKGGTETQKDLCWQTCHKVGPWDGTWFDYGE